MYCLANKLYYDAPDQIEDIATRYLLNTCPATDGWHQKGMHLWTIMQPPGTELPEQGWKIHVSSTPDDASEVLHKVANICFDRRSAFKFLRSEESLRLMNGKYMLRQYSGKFITVYPADDADLAQLIHQLSVALRGRKGPYILSDLRIGDGPVFVRYGAFTPLSCLGRDGSPVPALRAPDGTLQPDERLPVFSTPPWVTLPSVLTPHVAALQTPIRDDLPYRVREALQFTNGGGIYIGEHIQTGDLVVLREARPNAGLDPGGTDAVTRLHRSYEVRQWLAGLPCVPRVLGLTKVWEHHYLIEEYVEGETLVDAVIARSPLVRLDAAESDFRIYTEWAQSVADRVRSALDALHDRGVAFGDLHPENVVLRPDGSVVLVDFEYAAIGDIPAPRAAAPGFAVPPHATGYDADRHQLETLRLWLHMPLFELVDLHPAKRVMLEQLTHARFQFPQPPAQYAEDRDEQIVRQVFGLPATDVGWLNRDDYPDGRPAVPDWPAIRRLLTAGLQAAATPDSADRLFPLSPEGFSHTAQGALGLAHGAAGVLHALHRAGEPIPGPWIDWLEAAALRATPTPEGGLFGGSCGTAAVLYSLGRKDTAFELLHQTGHDPVASGPGLNIGTAGRAIALLGIAIAANADHLLYEAVSLGEQLLASSAESPAGLLGGMAGTALLYLRLHHATSDPQWLPAARRALAHDLAQCVILGDGTMHVQRNRFRHLPYLAEGSAGIALVAREYLALAEDRELTDFVAACRRTCSAKFVREPGLFQGRAGMAAALAALDGDPCEITAQVARIAWHAVHRDGTLLIPGSHLLRHSADLATGAAGVILALHCICDKPEGGLLDALFPRSRTTNEAHQTSSKLMSTSPLHDRPGNAFLQSPVSHTVGPSYGAWRVIGIRLLAGV
jgi:serine/threonine protein kinase